ncbi:hypothetical protein [Streptomyces sp. 3214.6]|uniref:hypothetical protein n=1 Tax=Streptomyces sp. 3214.6 TaxID=1882757 RepID=UPI00090B9BAD|nr:hypothetical protein [Streptomyces sp. 3214.6]SHH35121.1 hypothetical protein SAMN05444521_0205 [Streptomyces sp. 3214.6]
MTNTKRVLAAAALAAAVLSCSGVAQAQQETPAPSPSGDQVIDLIGQAFTTILNKQAETLIGNLLNQ